MKKLLLFGYLSALGVVLTAQDIPHIKAAQLSAWKNADTDTVLVLNFWATWCAPCVEELPYFEELYRKHAGADLQIWMVSLDFKSKLEKQFIPFLQQRQMKMEMILLSDQDADSWIPRVYPSWQGTLPATLIVHNGQRAFHAEQFANYEQLENFVLSFLKKIKKKPGEEKKDGSR